MNNYLKYLVCTIVCFFSFEKNLISMAADDPHGHSRKRKKEIEEKSLSLNDLIATGGKYNRGDKIEASVAEEALSRKGETGKAVAYSIVQDILSRYKSLNSGREWTTFINTMMIDHAGQDDEDARGVLEGNTYFRTNNRRILERIIEKTINEPDNYTYYPDNRGRCELEISRHFSEQEVQQLIGKNNLGKIKGSNRYANTVLVCFGLGVGRFAPHKPFNSPYWRGGSMTTTHLRP